MTTATATATNMMIGQGKVVHATFVLGNGQRTALCGSSDKSGAQVRWHKPVVTMTSKPVTCKRCLESLKAAQS